MSYNLLLSSEVINFAFCLLSFIVFMELLLVAIYLLHYLKTHFCTVLVLILSLHDGTVPLSFIVLLSHAHV